MCAMTSGKTEGAQAKTAKNSPLPNKVPPPGP
jgi:hypothetical protein